MEVSRDAPTEEQCVSLLQASQVLIEQVEQHKKDILALLAEAPTSSTLGHALGFHALTKNMFEVSQLSSSLLGIGIPESFFPPSLLLFG